MIHLFLFELKNLFKQKKTWIMIGILLILSVYLINDFKEKSIVFDDYRIIAVQSRINRFEETLERVNLTIETGVFYRYKIDISNVIEYKKTLILLLDSLHRKEQALINQDWESFHNEQLFYEYWHVSNYVSDITYLRNQKLIDESYEIIKLQTEVKSKMNYPELVFPSYNGMSNVIKDVKYFYKNYLKYSYQVVQNEVYTNPVHRFTMNGSTFIYHFFAQFWVYIFVIQILLNFNDINDSRNFGTNKLIYTLPYKRSIIILSKFFISIFSTLIVILFPLLLVSLFLFFKDGYSQLNLPVLINPNSWCSFTGIENNFKYDIMGQGGKFSIGISYFSSYPRGSGEFHPLLDFIKLKEFYGLILISLIINMSFLSSLILLVSQYIRQKMLALMIILSTFGMGVFLTQIDPNAFISKFNPFAGFDMILLNGGSSSITLLNSLIVLSISTIILLGINQYLINKTSS